VVPDEAILEMGIRPLPEGNADELVGRIRQEVAAALGKAAPLEVGGAALPMLVEDGTAVHRALSELAPVEPLGVSYATDGGWLQKLGLDCVLYGPGSIEVAHRPNEYVPSEHLEQARRTLDSLVARMCG
jgi:acetylornithine deacetylase